jgi:hypothetical protein
MRVRVCRARGEGDAMRRTRRKGWASGCEISLPRYTAELRADGVHDGSSSREGAFGLRLNGQAAAEPVSEAIASPDLTP